LSPPRRLKRSVQGQRKKLNFSQAVKPISEGVQYLLAHGLRVGDRCAEEAIPLQPAVEAGPVIVAVPSVRQTPGDQGVKLPVCRVARSP